MPNFMTRDTFLKFSNELKQIAEVEIPRISKAKQQAAEEGDLSENAEYIACREKLDQLNARFENVKQRISDPCFIDDLRIPGTLVSIGTIVEIRDLSSGGNSVYTILGSPDADPDRNIISYSSPIAKGMMGKKPGDTVDVQVPEGVRKFSIISIRNFKK